MAGLTRQTPHPVSITVHQQSRVLEVTFADGAVALFFFVLLDAILASPCLKPVSAGAGPAR